MLAHLEMIPHEIKGLKGNLQNNLQNLLQLIQTALFILYK